MKLYFIPFFLINISLFSMEVSREDTEIEVSTSITPSREEQVLAENVYQAVVAPISRERGNTSPRKTGFAGAIQWFLGRSVNREEEKHMVVTMTTAQLLEKMRQESPEEYEKVKKNWTVVLQQQKV